ncbi:MAG: transglutaminase family protein [Alphaproteobacteria bacterium]|nr:transglutaminase family protein [Alphaproteobacteria bacterium]
MLLKISHLTRYHYDEPVHYSLQQVRLTPKSRAGQSVVRWETTIEGGVKELEFEDQNNNHVMLVSVKDGQTELSIHCAGEVETTVTNGIVGEHGGCAPLWYFRKPTPLTQPGAHLRKLVKALGDAFDGDIERMHALSGVISKTVAYEAGRTHSETTAEDALGSGHGVCQDHAHIFIAAARLMGYPARYVSGYLMMDDRIEQDASHAWAEVYIPGVGWIGFDVSNNISPDERYVRIATGLDYKDAAPISGMRFGDSAESMIVSLQVQQ